VGWAGKEAVVATGGGELYLFKGAEIAAVVAAHRGSINALHTAADGRIATGGADGVVNVWSSGLEKIATADLAVLLQNGAGSCGRNAAAAYKAEAIATAGAAVPAAADSNSVRSVCISPNGGKVLVGTLGSELFELSLNGSGNGRGGDGSNGRERAMTALHGGEPLVRGHWRDELWGLAAHPTAREYSTCGDDRTLRVWSVAGRRQLRSADLGGMARCCAYHPAGGAFLAVGMGGSVGRGRQKCDGVVKFFRDDRPGRSGGGGGGGGSNGALVLLPAAELHDTKQWISDVRFSPDGRTLAVASHDHGVYLYAVTVATDGASLTCRKRARFGKHNSYVTHLDFSADSQHLRSTCGAYELLFSEAATGAQVTSARALRDAVWSSTTCPLGWEVQGIWPPCADGTDVNAVDRSASGVVLATADDFGCV
ncbi:unnamed protein product, partial [Phaeothamnion confervicola]